MPELTRSTVCLRIVGDTLDPTEITRLLGVEPTDCARKGDTWTTTSGREMTARIGSWRRDVGVSGSLDTQINALFEALPNDLAIWRELSQRFRCDVFCGLFIRNGNAGTELQPSVLSMLGDRGLRLGFDIYDVSD